MNSEIWEVYRVSHQQGLLVVEEQPPDIGVEIDFQTSAVQTYRSLNCNITKGPVQECIREAAVECIPVCEVTQGSVHPCNGVTSAFIALIW